MICTKILPLVAVAWLLFIVPFGARGQTAPANDNLANAQLVTGANFSVNGNNAYATTELNEPAADGSRTIWYLWTAPANLKVTLSSSAAATGVVLNAYQVSGTGTPSYGQFNYVASSSSAGNSASITFPAAANTTYAFAVGASGQSGTNGAIALSLASTPGDPAWVGPASPTTNGPANDNLANAQPLTGTQFSAVGYDGAATTETGEPAGDGINTIWYLWTAPGNLNVTLSTNASTNGAILNAYQVSGTGGLVYGQCNYVASNISDGPTATITFPAAAGTTYAIAVGTSYVGTANGAVILSLSSTQGGVNWAGPAAPTSTHPANDNLANAQPLTGTQFSVIGYDGRATTETGKPSADGNDTIWYLWTAPTNLNVTLSTNASANGAILNAYQVSGTGGLVYGRCNYVASNSSDGATATITFPAAAGTTYAIAVGTAYPATTNGSVILSLSSTQGDANWVGPAAPTSTHPANDSLANAQPLTGTQFSVVGYDGAATTDLGEPSGDGNDTIWYLWTAPANLMVTLATNATANGSILNAYQVGGSGAPAYGQLNSIASNSNGGSSATITFPAVANTTYAFVVGTYYPATSNGSVILSMIGTPLGLSAPVFGAPSPTGNTPVNDNFANAGLIRDVQCYDVAYNACATTELGEPSATGYNTVWYTWTPQVTGFATFETIYATYAHQISVFIGKSITGLTETGSQVGQAGSGRVLASVSFVAIAHITYHIAIGTQSPNSNSGGVIMGLIAPGKNVFTNAGRFSGFLDPAQDNFINVSVSSSGAVSGKAIIGGKIITLAGGLSLTGSFGKTVSGVAIRVVLDPTGASSNLVGSVTTGNAEYPFSLPVTAYTSTNPPPGLGKFTVLIAPDANAGPPGYGAGTLTIQKEGALTFAGRLADGTPFSSSGWISQAGTWDMDLPLYANAGRLTGVITFQHVANQSDFSGNLTWVKPTTSKGAGFTASPIMMGSAYKPQRPALALAGPATATFSSGGLVTTGSFTALSQLGGTVKTTGLTLKFNETTGVITGSFTPSAGARPLSVYGAAYQDQDIGAGYFVGTGGNGCFQFGN